jgi:hypothetical protein
MVVLREVRIFLDPFNLSEQPGWLCYERFVFFLTHTHVGYVNFAEAVVP